MQINNIPPLSSNEANHEKYGMLDELVNIKGDYLQEVLTILDKVKNGELDHDAFGFEATEIHLFNKTGTPTATIFYNYYQDELEVPFEDIYNLMHDWHDYLQKWEAKKTEKTKQSPFWKFW